MDKKMETTILGRVQGLGLQLWTCGSVVLCCRAYGFFSSGSGCDSVEGLSIQDNNITGNKAGRMRRVTTTILYDFRS